MAGLPTSLPPSIRVTDSNSSPSRSSQHSSVQPGSSDELPFHLRSVGPMSIPNARTESPPPPLPPPRYIEDLNDGQDTGWQYANSASARDHDKISASVKPGSSLLGGGYLRSPQAPSDMISSEPGTRDSMHSTGSSDSRAEGDNRRASPDNQAGRDNRLHGERHLGQRSLASSSHAYDKHLLARIGGPRTPPRGPGSAPTSGENSEPAAGQQNSFKKLNGQLKPLSMPERTSTVDSPRTRWPQSAGQASPSFAGMQSPSFDNPYERIQLRRYHSSSTLTGREDSASLASQSHRGSYDHGMFEQEYEDNGMKDLHLHDPHSADYESKAGMKRRANSPPTDTSLDPRLGGHAAGDSWGRRPPQMHASQDSPVARFHANQGSYSSTSSYGVKNGSYPSSYGLSAPSSATSYGSERLSPVAMQLAHEEAGYGIAKMTQPSARAPTMVPHMRQGSDARPAHMRKLSGDLSSHVRHTSSPRMQTLYICECCPKKPRKFDSADELRIHEMEKQYICQYCHNRFKNKNEAERHQNSLHLRRHSWSCAALTTFEDAFHAHATHPGLADICGYCGEEFANPPNWDIRVEHLNHEHKFGECNHAKKFFRADHFRQHLKHSHAGKSGKWTNMLENACMKEEPPPQPIRHHDTLPGMSTMAPMAPMGAMAGMRHVYASQLRDPNHYRGEQ